MRRGDAQRRDSDSVTLGNGLLCCLGRAKENNRGDLPVTARTREEELREVPLWKANKGAWPPGVRPIGMDEADCLGVDRRGNLYWDGKPVEVRNFALTFGQKVWAGIVAVSAVVGAVGAAATRMGVIPRVGVRRRMVVGGHMRTFLAQALP